MQCDRSPPTILGELSASICLLTFSCWFIAWLIRRFCKWRANISPKRLALFELHNVETQEAVLYMFTCENLKSKLQSKMRTRWPHALFLCLKFLLWFGNNTSLKNSYKYVQNNAIINLNKNSNLRKVSESKNMTCESISHSKQERN